MLRHNHVINPDGVRKRRAVFVDYRGIICRSLFASAEKLKAHALIYENSVNGFAYGAVVRLLKLLLFGRRSLALAFALAVLAYIRVFRRGSVVIRLCFGIFRRRAFLFAVTDGNLSVNGALRMYSAAVLYKRFCPHKLVAEGEGVRI